MRTTINVDKNLLEVAHKASGFKTKKATVEEGLRLLLQIRAQGEIRKWRGKLKWEGSLEDMRRD